METCYVTRLWVVDCVRLKLVKIPIIIALWFVKPLSTWFISVPNILSPRSCQITSEVLHSEYVDFSNAWNVFIQNMWTLVESPYHHVRIYRHILTHLLIWNVMCGLMNEDPDWCCETNNALLTWQMNPPLMWAPSAWITILPAALPLLEANLILCFGDL